MSEYQPKKTEIVKINHDDLGSMMQSMIDRIVKGWKNGHNMNSDTKGAPKRMLHLKKAMSENTKNIGVDVCNATGLDYRLWVHWMMDCEFFVNMDEVIIDVRGEFHLENIREKLGSAIGSYFAGKQISYRIDKNINARIGNISESEFKPKKSMAGASRAWHEVEDLD